ncbi:ATP-binding protein, partial [Kineococcus indalonis]|uniref:ATP-binding protein n=1 Tax=Kineococcus indalonis TaxID=2696566 RepID=UPI001411B4E0
GGPVLARRSSTRRRRAALLAACAVVLAAVAGATASAGTRGDYAFVLASLGAGTAFALTGALLVGLRAGNRLGPVLLGSGTAMVADFALRGYAVRGLELAPGSLPGAPAAAWLGFALDPLFFPVPLAVVLLLFPDGRLPSRRWRAVLALAPAVLAVHVALLLLRDGPLQDETHRYEIAWSGPLPSDVVAVTGALTLAGIALLLAAVASLVLRHRRSDALGRQRLRPLALAGALAATALVVQGASPAGSSLEAGGRFGFVAVVTLGFPLALAVGALRYRLWELDRVLVATIVHALLALVITAVYVAVVVALPALAGAGRQDLDLLPSVLATAVVAVGFAPARQRLTRWARRAVYGVRADPYRALAALPHRLAEAPTVEEVLPRTAEALRAGLGVPAARVRAFAAAHGAKAGEDTAGEDGGAPVVGTAWAVSGADSTAPGTPAEFLEPGELLTVTVRHLGVPVGDVAVLPSPDRPLSAADHRLLRDLAAQAGPALRAAALTAELRLRLEQINEQAQELRASRARIVSAQSAERRRLERDLHDGAQQQLVALGVHLRSALEATEPTARTAAVQRCLDELGTCLDDLRELARGIHPPVLAAHGLAAALRARARAAGGRVRVQVGPGAAGVRWESEVELAVYFTCLEALQNAAKHAPAAEVLLTLEATGERLTFTVTDDGPGFDATRTAHGSGLVGMADRTGALGGTLRTTSAPGAGTSVRGSLPATPRP